MILRGWKEICEACGGMSRNTVRHLARSEGFPVTVVAHRPMSTEQAIHEWIAKRCQEKKDISKGAPEVTGCTPGVKQGF